jgi:GntR family histidine utilization transcriptional repressor
VGRQTLTSLADIIDSAADTPALYAGVKQMILAQIRAGTWPPGHKLPSENDLVRQFGISRMTVNRALRELSMEGAILRMQGVGSFVAHIKPAADLLEVRNIADEIEQRGHTHAARLVLAAQEAATDSVAAALDVPPGADIYHSILVHLENRVPVQIEDRFVNPAAAPGYLAHDFTRITPHEVLTRAAPLSETEHLVEAVLPVSWESRLLGIAASEPCLLMHRRTWSGAQVVTSARLLYPGARYRLQGRRKA